MTATIIDGKAVARSLRTAIAEEVKSLQQEGIVPGLAVVLVGNDPASHSYVKGKVKACEEVGIHSEVLYMAEETSQAELLQTIEQLSKKTNIHGILVQLPLPPHISEEAVLDVIPAEKDVDGFHPLNVGNMVIGKDTYLPCTPHGIVELIKSTGTELTGKHVVVVGRSSIVGKPVSLLLLQENATVTMCHSRTRNLADVTRQADILVVAVGKPHLIGKEHVAPGAIVIDVGVNRLDNGKLVGDVRFDEVAEVAGYITPVPGGVGPMTITMLLANTVKAAKLQSQAARR